MKKVENSSRSKLIKNFASSKGSNLNNALYAGVASAQRSIQKPGSLQTQNLRQHTIVELSENSTPPCEFHPWRSEYTHTIIREKIRKSMTKDPYMSRSPASSQATESVTTQEECCPAIIPASAIHIEIPVVQQDTKAATLVTVRYLRGNEPLGSQRDLTEISTKSFTQSTSKSDTKKSTSSIQKTKGVHATCFSATDRLLKRPVIRSDPSLIRRPPRRLTLNVTHDTVIPLTICG